MVKNRVLFCNNSLGGNAWRYLAPFYDVIRPIDHVSLTLDCVTSFLCVINIRNIRSSSYLHFSFFTYLWPNNWWRAGLPGHSVRVVVYHFVPICSFPAWCFVRDVEIACVLSICLFIIRCATWQNQQSGMCAQRRLRSTWASTQSDQSLRCARYG